MPPRAPALWQKMPSPKQGGGPSNVDCFRAFSAARKPIIIIIIIIINIIIIIIIIIIIVVIVVIIIIRECNGDISTDHFRRAHRFGGSATLQIWCRADAGDAGDALQSFCSAFSRCERLLQMMRWKLEMLARFLDAGCGCWRCYIGIRKMLAVIP